MKTHLEVRESPDDQEDLRCVSHLRKMYVSFWSLSELEIGPLIHSGQCFGCHVPWTVGTILEDEQSSHFCESVFSDTK